MDSQKQTTLAILGDSYSTFAGLMPQGNYIYYPHEGIPDVADAEDTWWRQLIARRHLRLLINDSSSGTTISTQVRPNHKESDAFIHRMKVSLSPSGVKGEMPDLILIFGGTNDSWINNEIGQLQFENWTEADLKAVLPAYCYLLHYMTQTHPQARIVGIVNCNLKEGIQKGLMEACRHYGVTGVQLHDISKVNGHPDKLGMKQICDQVEAVL